MEQVNGASSQRNLKLIINEANEDCNRNPSNREN